MSCPTWIAISVIAWEALIVLIVLAAAVAYLILDARERRRDNQRDRG